VLEMELFEIRIDESHWRQPQIIVLKEKQGERTLPIVIGLFEAQAIYIKINNLPTVRPFSHDLMNDLINNMGGKLDRILVDELKSDTFYAKLFVTTDNGKELIVDSRPSDAIALAIRSGCPIFVNEEVLERINSEEQ
jgi:bifunctional DNase/RNase